VADWPAGKPGDFLVDPASRSFSGPRPYTQIYFTDNQLTQSADRLSIQRTGHDVPCVSPSELTTVMYLIHSPAGYRLPETKLFLMRTIKPYCRFYDHNWHFINESRLYFIIVATVLSIPDQSRAHTRIYIKLPYFSSFLFLRRL